MSARGCMEGGITIDGVHYDTDGILAWGERLLRSERGAPWASDLVNTLRQLTSGDGGLDVHTSGTTGTPKHMHLPARDLVASAELTRLAFGLHAGDRVLLCLPCEFIGGKMMVVRAMVIGLDLHCIDPKGGVLRNLRSSERFRFSAMIPAQLHTALQQDRQRVEETFDTILLGGGPVSDDLIAAVQDLGCRVVMGYGSTETVTHVALRALNGPDAADHYRSIGDVRFTTNASGCLVLHTPHLSVSEQVTNDVVELLDECCFRWTGRADNVILSGGRKIHPERLEAMTAEVVPYPHFFAATPDERLGQVVTLVIETGEDGTEAPPGVLSAIHHVLYDHERPRRTITMRRFIRTGSGKVERMSTLALAWRY